MTPMDGGRCGGSGVAFDQAMFDAEEHYPTYYPANEFEEAWVRATHS